MPATSLPWAPPGYPSYSGYTALSISNANKGTLASLNPAIDYLITFTEKILGTVLGTPALEILGGRNVVAPFGLEVEHSATQQTTTLTGAVASAATTITLASNTGFAAND